MNVSIVWKYGVGIIVFLLDFEFFGDGVASYFFLEFGIGAFLEYIYGLCLWKKEGSRSSWILRNKFGVDDIFFMKVFGVI